MKPVFVDRTGQRRRLVKIAGMAAGLALAAVSLLLVAGFTGAGPGHLPLLPEPVGGAPAAPRPSAETRPAPSPSPDPVRTSASPPATTAAPAASATPEPSRSSHRRVPTHTPGHGNKPSKPS